MIYKMTDPECLLELSEALDSPEQLLSMYQTYTMNDMKSLHRSIVEQDNAITISIAHKLTGSFSFIGANAFVQLSRKLEQAATEQQDTATQAAIFQEMEQVFHQVIDEIRAFVAGQAKDSSA